MFGWHHWFNEHEFEQALGDRAGQGILACRSTWGHRVRHNWVIEQQEKNIWFYCKSILNPKISIISIYIKLHIKIRIHRICFSGLCNIVLKHLQLHIIYTSITITITYLTCYIYLDILDIITFHFIKHTDNYPSFFSSSKLSNILYLVIILSCVI